jgi:small subunit ribosomal protein S4
VNLFGSQKYQKILQRNQNIPGMHGGKRMGKLTEYAKQLREKQKAKRMFGLSEKQFKNYFQKAARMQGVRGDNLLQLLERRLDNVLYRAGLAITRAQARQFVSHGLFLLNGRKVDVPSILIRPGDIVEIKPSKKGSPIFNRNKESIGDYKAPNWIRADHKKLAVEIQNLPSVEHFEQVIEPQMIVEFYSR